MKYYTVDGYELTEEQARQIEQENKRIFEEVDRTGDFSKLNNVILLFSEEVEKAISSKR